MDAGGLNERMGGLRWLAKHDADCKRRLDRPPSMRRGAGSCSSGSSDSPAFGGATSIDVCYEAHRAAREKEALPSEHSPDRCSRAEETKEALCAPRLSTFRETPSYRREPFRCVIPGGWLPRDGWWEDALTASPGAGDLGDVANSSALPFCFADQPLTH